MMIRIAAQNDLDALHSFFNEIIDHQIYDEYGAGWTRDVYPSRTDLEEKISNDLFYLILEDEKILAAACLSLHEDDIYLDKPWTFRCRDHRIATLHLFAVHPDHRRKNIADMLLRHIIEEAEDQADAIHLDAVADNLPAIRLYEKHGFRSIGLYDVYYPDTGQIVVNLLEYDYEKKL